VSGGDTTWFDECRYGMFVHANIATVPAFAPVHEYADWYWAFLETKPDMVLHPTCPLPEVLAWHNEHARGRAFDDFIPQLTFERFDADEYAQLLDDAGMRYLVHVTKHHDGFCWWDTTLSTRSSVHLGPKRDVTAALADAVRRRGHKFGCYYSLLDWSHEDYPDPERYVDAYMRPQIQELVERFEPALLWGDGHWGHPGGHWRSDAILANARAIAAERGFELVCNDRWFAASHDYAVYEYDVPETPPAGRWELCRGLGYSFCVNRNERVEDHLDAAQVVALLVETVAKGGNLLLNVGPNADGTVPDIQTRVLRESGEWVRANAGAIHGSTRFDVPGDGQHWYTRVGPTVHAFDLASAAEPQFAGLGTVQRVRAADGTELAFGIDSGVVSIDARAVARHELGTRYVVELATQDRVAVAEPVPGGAARAGKRYATITEALSDAQAGDTIDVGPGRYSNAIGERFPLVVPAGVTLRAGGSLATRRVVIDAGGAVGVQLAGDGAALERLTVTGAAPGYMMVPPTCVVSSGGSNLVVRECHVESIALTGGTGHRVIANVVAGGAVTLVGTDACEVRANYQHGLRWGVGIMMVGGAGHAVSENECRDDLCGIRLSNTDGARVDHNRAETRWWGIHLIDARGTAVVSNQVWHTMRAVDVEGATARDNLIDGLLAEHCDTGVMVERGATGTRVVDSWFHDCRVGLLAWEAGPLEITGTAISAPRDHAVVSDRPLDLAEIRLEEDQLDGDVWIAT
jgi:alpha-L-fucosidase